MRESAQLPPLASLAAMSVVGSSPTTPAPLPSSTPSSSSLAAAQSIHLIVEFPSFPHPLVYSEKNCNPAPPPLLPVSDPTRVFTCHDPELARENPVEQKYHKLSRSAKGLSDRDLKPRIAERRALDRIISSPVTRLTREEKELLWKFRFSLLDDRRALTKFLRAVDWSDVVETAEAVSLLGRWTAVDIAAALEMLSSSFTNEEVRAYAVKQLARADNDEISAYLLQLVQALRYETNYPSPLSSFLIDRCTASMQLCNFFYWSVNTTHIRTHTVTHTSMSPSAVRRQQLVVSRSLSPLVVLVVVCSTGICEWKSAMCGRASATPSCSTTSSSSCRAAPAETGGAGTPRCCWRPS